MIDIDIQRLTQIQRVNVIGTSGSGKSTFGRKLAEYLRLPFVEMDSIYWGPNWTETTDEEFFPKIEAITNESRWVLDGNYSRTTRIKWSQVQLVVWLDMSFLRTLFRVTRRCWQRSRTQSEIWPGTGNRETLRKAFLSRDSVILWSITSYRRNRRNYAEIMCGQEKYAHIWLVRLQTPAEVNAFLDAAKQASEFDS